MSFVPNLLLSEQLLSPRVEQRTPRRSHSDRASDGFTRCNRSIRAGKNCGAAAASASHQSPADCQYRGDGPNCDRGDELLAMAWCDQPSADLEQLDFSDRCVPILHELWTEKRDFHGASFWRHE